MKIAALSTREPWVDRISRRGDEVYSERIEGARFEARPELTLAEIREHGPERQHRPYLHLEGEARSLVPVDADGEPLPLLYGVAEITWPEGRRPLLVADMEFTNEGVAALYTEFQYGSTDFEGVPEEIVQDEGWELPVAADILIVGPLEADEPPLVFVDEGPLTVLGYDEADPVKESGYGNIVDYFRRPDPEPTAEVQALAEKLARTRQGAIDDLFAGVEFVERAPESFEEDYTTPAEAAALAAERAEREAQDRAVTTGLVPDGVFKRLFERREQAEPLLTAPEPEVQLPEEELEEAERLFDAAVAPDVAQTIDSRPREGSLVEAAQAAPAPEEQEEPPLAPLVQPELPEELRPEPGAGGERPRTRREIREAEQRAAGVESQDEDLLEKAERTASVGEKHDDLDFGD